MGRLDVAGAAVVVGGTEVTSVTRRLAAIVLATLSMAHVGSPDTFFAGRAGPYDVRVTVRLPGVIPGRAQVSIRVTGATATSPHRVTVQAAQWNVGLTGAPPPEPAVKVPGDPALFASELWFMTAQPYQLSVVVVGPAGPGSVLVPVMAIATAERPMPPWLGGVLAALGLFLVIGMLTIIGAAVRESVLPPGVEPDRRRTRSGRIGMGLAGVIVALVLWGGNTWWATEAANYGRFILYRPFDTTASVSGRRLTLGIRDDRWTGTPYPNSRYNALLPDHGKLMHMFLIGEAAPKSGSNGFAHVHPIARTPEGLNFDVSLPAALPSGRYRVYSDIVHESGYAQTLVNTIDLPSALDGPSEVPDEDDAWSDAAAVPMARTASFAFDDGTQLVWEAGDGPMSAGTERELKFSVRDAGGRALPVEPYMGMAAHVAIANRDGSVFAHLHPSGSVSMAALQKISNEPSNAHEGHIMMLDSAVAIPYAFPKAGAYRMWVQVKREGRVRTAAFDADVK